MFVRINDNKLKVETCLSEKKIQDGMMNKKFSNFDGMLFFMGPGEHCFYMKNCIVPLDIIFIDSNLNIVDIFDNCPPCKEKDCELYCSEADFVLELPGNYCSDKGISIGDSCFFNF